MNVLINLGKREEAINDVSFFKNKRITSIDIKFENVHLCYVNEILERTVFRKNDLYIDSLTLYELMQPIGTRGGHNSHDLTPEDIVDALLSCKNPSAIVLVKEGRYGFLTIKQSHFGKPLLVVIELKASLAKDINFNANKIVTIYPKDDLDEFLSKFSTNSILFPKNKK